ncbi:FAD/NAD(P)-binding domain-containing protein [Zopfia rhizophila CBS 207.26]|uniref:FAD/NAD(P)-binding domain-containing protein n=1 Tax=Zopfia rhizophila CBS 207.26 TaxID=1314779 RepID=A0A6A6EXU0_9PEZI|nr:FAD/NAD(P)-binding domain-containing protein [Zopfia rhizophila CBS 207.26]
MHILIIGAGIGGLSAALALSLAGHTVTVLESAAALAEIGAGVQMTPNATRWFWRWGLGPDILRAAAVPGGFNVRRGRREEIVGKGKGEEGNGDGAGEVLGRVEFGEFAEKYGAPYVVIHRADVHRILHEHAVRAGVELRLGCRVVKYGFDESWVLLEKREGRNEEEVVRGDLVVACDGIGSFARSALLGADPGRGGAAAPPFDGTAGDEAGEWLEKTRWAAYRTWAPVDKIKADPELRGLVEKHECNCWVGDGRLVMTYMVKNSEILNMVLSHRDDVDTSSWTLEQYKDEIGKLFDGWDPRLRRLLDVRDGKVQNWPIYQVKTLPRWTSETGRFVLIGDAAHAMAFYLSMGVSMAVEDAAGLVECLKLLEQRGMQGRSVQMKDEKGLDFAMKLFESVRKSRAQLVKDASLHAGNVLQLPPGREREERDRNLRDGGESTPAESRAQDQEKLCTEGTAYGIADHRIRDWCYGYDVVEEVRKEWVKATA